MTLPASGPISTAMIRAEIGGSGAIIIPSSEVRTLTGVASGPIDLPGDFYGKSGAGAYAATAAPTNSGAPNGGASAAIGCAVAGGVGPFTYLWQKVSGDTLTLSHSTSATTTFTGAVNQSAVYRCRVRDTGNSNAEVFSNNVTLNYAEIPGGVD